MAFLGLPKLDFGVIRHVGRFAPIAVAGGAFIGFAMGRFRWNPRGILHGGLIGFTCFALAILGEMLFHNWLEEKKEQWWRRALVYFVAGQIGWPMGLYLGMPLIQGEPMSSLHMSREVWIVVLASGAVGTALGVSMFGYERLKDRLRASVVELKEKEYAEKELELAREFQARMLPAPEIVGNGYKISARNLAARVVAGDFYDVFQYGDGAVGVAVADVAGKGIASSLIMASVKAVVPLLATTREVRQALSVLNEKLAVELGRRQFVAMALARYEPASGRLSVSNAGLPDPFLIRADGHTSIIEVSGPRVPLGALPKIEYQEAEVILEPGDAVMLFSDGLPEATASDGEQLGYERLAGIVRASRGDIETILQGVNAVTSAVLEDDQTIVVLARRS